MNLRFFKSVLFVFLFLPTTLFAHETRLETPFTPKSFASRIGINGDGNSIVAWDRKQGGVVYILENEQWKLKDHLRSDDNNWKRIQSLDVSGNYAAFTSYPDKNIYVYRWNNDNKTWNFYKKFEHRFSSSVIIKITDSGSVLIQDYGNGIIDIYNPHLNRFTKQITPPEDGIKLNGNIDINGNILIVSSSTNSFVYKNYSLVAKLPSAYTSSSYGSSMIALRPNALNEVHIYKYDRYSNDNGGWYKSETILPPPISNSIDNHGISGTGKYFGSGPIKIIGNKLYITDIVDLDGKYGMMNNTSNNNHSVIYEYNLIDAEWKYKRLITPADFSHNYLTWNFLLSKQGDKLVLGDSTAHQVLNTNPHTSGAAYVFDLNDTTDLTLNVSAPESHQIIGDIVSYQFKVTNSSENTASNVIFENDYNPNTGLWDNKNDSDLRFVSVTTSQGLCTNQNYATNRVTCNIGNLSPGESVDIIIEMSPEFVYKINTFARVYADQFDDYYDDNFNLTSIYVSPENVKATASILTWGTQTPYSCRNETGLSTPSLSADGKFISFYSKSGLASGSNNVRNNIYTVNRESKDIEISSIPNRYSQNYQRANGDSFQPKISNAADLVAFSSSASNVIENDTNKQQDVFLHRRSTGETYRISESYYGEGGNKSSSSPDISADGRYVVFTSRADNLYSSDNNGDRDIYLHDVNRRRLTWIDISQGGIDGLRLPSRPSISGDGTYISFTARTSQGYAAYLWNRNTWKAIKISPDYNPDGTVATSPGKTEVSDNGQYVTYALNGYIYKYNIQTEENELISLGLNSEIANSNSYSPSISADGRYIVYSSYASNLIENDTNGFSDIFVYDSVNKTTRIVNIGVGGFQTKNHSNSPTISADGNTIAYITKVHNLIFDDTNEVADIFFEGNPFTTEPAKEVDLSIEKTASSSSIEIGKNVTYTLTINNIAVDPEAIATEVSITDELPAGLTFVSATPSIGTCSENSGAVTCDLGDIAVGDPSVTVDIIAKTTKTGNITNSASVSASETDSDISNNSSEVSVTVIELTDAYINGSIDDTVTYYIGDELTYSFEVGNNSSNPATDVTAEIVLPTNLSISSVDTDTGICSTTGQKVTCIVGDISSTNANITVEATSSAAGNFDVEASVTTTKTDSNEDNNSDTVSVTIKPKSDIAVSLSDSSDPIYAGNNLTYTITVKNNGPSDASNIKIEDTLPSGISFISASTGCSEAAGVVTCDIASLAKGVSTSVQVVIKPSVPETITNKVTVSATEFDPVITNNSASEDTVVKAVADLSITQTDDPDPVYSGSNVTYTLKVTNNGINTASNIKITDTLPTGVTFVSASTGCSEATGVVTCNVTSLAKDTSTSVNVVVKTGAPGTITNKASVSATEYDPDTDNNSSEQSTEVKAVTDMEIVSASASPNPVYAGDDLTYTVKIKNNATQGNTAQEVKLTFTFNDSIVLDSASGCAAAGNTVTCDIGSMTYNQEKDIQLVIQPDMDGDLGADINVSSTTHDPDTSNNDISVTTTVEPAVDLTITMIEDIDPILVGQDLTYTITVTNTGPSVAENVVLTDTLPGAAPVQSFTISSDTSSTGFIRSCVNNLTTLDCSLGDLTDDESVTITLVLQPTNGAVGALVNTATVSNDTYERQAIPDNNTASVTTTVNQSSTVKVSLKGKGSGTVTGVGISCPGDCEETFTRGDTVTLTATPAPGSTFDRWQGGVCKGKNDTCTITLDKPNMNVMASFK